MCAAEIANRMVVIDVTVLVTAVDLPSCLNAW